MKIRKRLSVIAVACCIVAGLGILPAASADTTGPAVASALWEVSSDTITLTDNVAVPDYMLYGEVLHDGSYVDITADSADDLLEDWQTSGLLVTAQAANKPLTFKNTVDIRAFTADDVLFAFTPLVASRGSETFKQLDLRLTDAEDPDNWVNIKFEQSRWVTGITVISVETPEFGPIGYKWGDYHADYRDDISSIGFSDNYYISFKGRTSEGGYTTMDDSERYRHRPIILHYDAADKCFYVTGQGGKRFAVLDLDDSHAVGYGYEWDGFGSGRVNVTVTTSQHMGSEIEYLILNAFDTPMGGSALTDTAAPVLAFGAEVQGDYAPVARTGYPYTLPDYTCDDIVSGALTCDIAVTDPDGQTVSLSDGGFTPGKDGLYKAVYTASDAAGNTVLRTLNIVAQKGVPAIEIDVTQPDVTEYAVGQDIVLPEASVRAGTGSGLPSLSVQVVREGAPNEPIAVTDGIFTPAVAGRYDAVYTAVDYLGTTMTKTIVYTVTDSGTPVEKGQVQRLRRLYDGIPVEIPVPEVYDYSSYPGTGVRSAVKVIVSGNGQSEEVTGPFTPDIDRFGTELTVRYEVGKETPVVLDEYTVAVTAMPEQSDEYEDVGAFQVTEYFTWDDSMQAVLNTAEESGYLQFKTEAGYSGDAHFSFNNPVRAENFSLSFAIPAAYQNFDSLVITLSDSVRADITFDLELRKITTGVVDPDTKTFVYYNGIRYAMNGRFNKWVTQNGMLTESNSVTPMRITYHDGIVGDADGDVLTVTHNTNGTAFYGFPSGKVYVDFTFRDVDGSTAGDAASGTSTGAGITIAGLVNQSFYADYWTSGENAGALRDFYDLSAPQIVLSSDLPDRYTLNQRVQIPSAAAYDVLSPYVEVTVSLQGPDGSMIFDNQPVSEGMAFTVSEYGSYFLEYRATDASGLGATRSYTIAARDYTPPTIALSATSLTGRVGQAVTLPDTDIVLAENGQTGYTVLLPAEATLAEQYAADLLVERFREATGATLPVEYDAGEPLDESRKTLSIGFTSVMRDSGITVTEAELNADGFKIVRRGNTVIMAGAHDGGHIYAVQEFLHRQFAYEVYATDEVYIETTDKAFVKDYNLTEIPDFATRDMDGLLSYAPELAVSLRMRQINLNNAQYGYGGSRDWMPHFGHTYYDLIPKDKYNVKPADGEENPDYHPEWYSSLQLCLTNEEMIATFIENFKPIILNNPYGRIVNIGENDGSGFCTCEKCTEEIRRYGRIGYTIRFANKVIAGLEAWKAEEPAVKDRDWVYAIFAYTASQTIAPPLDDNGNLVDPSCRPDDKLYIRITPLDPVCYAHPWSDPGECSTARTMYEHMQGWQTVTDNFMVWDYDANYSCYYMFHNTFNSTQKNLQLYRDMGVVNLFRENATGSTMRSLVDLNTYINCKLMWDVDADLQQLMDDFIDNFYKTGAPYIRQYIDMMRSYYDILDVTTDGGYHITNYQDVTVFGSKWPARIFEQALDLFDQAIATYAPLAESDPELYETMVNRVLKESVCVRFVILGNYATYYDINAAAYDEMIDQFEADAERVGATNYSEGGSLSDWIAGLRAA